jgi:type VI secretion system protein ImpF
MAEPLLQPALFDRLTDEARTVTLLMVELFQDAKDQFGFEIEEIVSLIEARGLRRVEESVQATDKRNFSDPLTLHFEGTGLLIQPTQLNDLVFMPRAATRRLRLHECGKLTVSSSPNTQIDPLNRRGISMARLRKLVGDDLETLLNTASLDSLEDLSRFPRIAKSVINFGMPSLAGRAASSIDPLQAAERIRHAIEQFEPRLSRVSVTPEPRADGESDGALAFHIAAELWGQPFPQALALRTRIDVVSGTVAIDDVG